MRLLVAIDTQKSDPDTVLIWDQETQLVAVAYQAGTTRMTRALEAASLEDAITETKTAFGIDSGYLARITNWSPRLEPPFPPLPDRFQI